MKSLGKRPDGARLVRMRASPMWTGDSFRNIHPITPGLRDSSAPKPTISEFLCGGVRRVPTTELPSFDPSSSWTKPPETGLRATWLGHSTVLLEIDGLRVLTDPVWGPRASPSTLRRAEALSARARRASRAAAARCGDRLARSLRSSRLPDDPRARARCNVPIVTSLGVGAHLEAWGVARERIIELDWWETHIACRAPALTLHHGRAVAALLRPRPEGSQQHAVVVVRDSQRPRHRVFFSGDTGLTAEYAEIRDAARAVRSRHARGRRVSSGVGRHSSRPGERARSARAARRRRRCCRCTGARSISRCTPGTSRSETLLALAPERGAQLVMPRLGEPVEPSRADTRADKITPWWRDVDSRGRGQQAAQEPVPMTLPKSMPWPAH